MLACWPLGLRPRGPSTGSLATGGFTEGVPRVVGVRNYEVGLREMLVAYHLPLHLPPRWGSQPGIRAKVVTVWSPFGASILCSFFGTDHFVLDDLDPRT